MSYRTLRLAVALTLVVVGLRWIVNTNPWSGPTIVSLSATHGVHINDWVSFVCWSAAALLVSPRLASTPVPALLRRSPAG